MSAVFQSSKDEKVGTREDRDPDATRAFARPAVESFEGRTRIMAFEFGGKKDQAKAAAFATFGQGGRTPGSAGSHKSPAALRTNLSMYAHAPSKEVALEEFELYALERMRVLKAIDDGLSRGKKPAEMELLITKEDKLLTRGSFHLEDDETRKDEVSHFALRLAYCRTEELRRWFLAQECALFRHRFRQLRGAQQAAFLQHNGLDYHPIDAKEFERVRADLHNTLNGMMRKDDANAALANGASGFYAVPFEEVSDLVRGRRVFMSGGKAYVPQVRSIQKFFTHRPVSTFDRVPFQLTGELFLYGTTLRTNSRRSSSARSGRGCPKPSSSRPGGGRSTSRVRKRSGSRPWCCRSRSGTSAGTTGRRAARTARAAATLSRSRTSTAPPRNRSRCARRTCSTW
jgi:hypothetical protein